MRPYGRLGDRIRKLVRGRTKDASSLSFAHLGLTYGAAVVIYALGGWWLDKKLGTLPLFTLLGVALGALGGFLWVYRSVVQAEAGKGRGKGEEATDEKDRESREP